MLRDEGAPPAQGRKTDETAAGSSFLAISKSWESFKKEFRAPSKGLGG